ncbi:MAG: peptide chain release factor 2 [Acidimicrobiaceae bacterium]|nr:peptide chain release factor 2 [Acidimicrobiaceae bacterium]
MTETSNEPRVLRQRLEEAEQYLQLEELLDRRIELEDVVAQPDLWDDADRARKISQELSEITDDITLHSQLSAQLEEAEAFLELLEEDPDPSFRDEADNLLFAVAKALDELELRSLFTGEYDESDAVCHIQSGEGGTEAQDWAEMLFRMYQRWAERQGFSLETTSLSEGTEAGISSVEFIVRGRRSYGKLQSEHGVHRLVRISPFNKQANRHTSFASMHVVPFFEEVSDEVVIDEAELRVDTYRSSGAGGQHVNVTDSAVRITHLPSGIVVSCQNERSQHQNKERCMQMLSARLLDLERKQREQNLASISGENQNVGFGSQIRSYVMQPYQMVKDLRSNYEVGAVDTVLDGGIDVFIEAYLRWLRSGSPNQ